jgi:hypothetical protein
MCSHRLLLSVLVITGCGILPAQDGSDVQQIEHISPVFDDLTTDLGARRMENELNANFGYRRYRNRSSELLSQLEYEIAPVNDLGVEVLIPYTAYFNFQGEEIDRPRNRFEFLQLTAQYTFLKAPAPKISLALGFRSILETQDPRRTDNDDLSLATVTHEPFLITAKNWNDRSFLLLIAGVQFIEEVQDGERSVAIPITTAFHQKIGSSDHVAGVEFNKSFEDGEFEMYVRPQVIFTFKEDYTAGLACGIPVELPEEKWHLFLRLAYAFK